MAKLTWKELDKLTTRDEIADALRKAGVKGRCQDPWHCPLANATDWVVLGAERRSRAGIGEILLEMNTEAETDFITRFDVGKYSDLEEKS